jgi:hypothetical protein
VEVEVKEMARQILEDSMPHGIQILDNMIQHLMLARFSEHRPKRMLDDRIGGMLRWPRFRKRWKLIMGLSGGDSSSLRGSSPLE